jgi:uncharacterized protein YbaP (TraB family)
MRLVLTCLLALVLALPAAAACTGRNQIDLLPPEARADLLARANAAPHAQGNLWRATRGDRAVTLVGTFHLDDPRHDALMARLAPRIGTAAVVLVEAGPAEEAALMANLARNPALMFAADGPTLPEILPPETWALLKQALRDRQIPPFMAARMQPAYLSMILGMPPCAMPDIQAGRPGLDKRIIAEATAQGIPVQALEPHDTLFATFDTLSPAEQRDMLDVSLALAAQSEDAFHTLAESYFAEDSRLIWELSRLQALDASPLPPEQVEAGFDRMEDLLILARNRAWIPVITAATDRGPVLAAFGALHLSGRDGVLDLLARDGWALERLPF